MIAIPSVQEQAFCRAYIANGGNTTAAAVGAGYSQRTARQAGYKALRRPRVREEIARLVNLTPGAPEPASAPAAGGNSANAPPKQSDKPPIVVDKIVIGASPLDGEILSQETASGADRDLAAKLSRDWVVARLMRHAMMCLGETPQTLVKLVTGVDAEGRTQVTAVQVKAFVHDAAGATAALAQLSKEVDRIQATVGARSTDTAQLPRRAQFEEAMQAYREAGELVRQAHAPKPNGSANGRGPTG
jgi:Terminase small subunit